MRANLRVLLLSIYVLTVGTWVASPPVAWADSSEMCSECFDTMQECVDWGWEACDTAGGTFAVCDPDGFCCPGGVQGYCDRIE
jgi:hypothetical protein